MQYLAGELAVEAGMVLPLRAAHNTVAMRFDIEVHTMHLAHGGKEPTPLSWDVRSMLAAAELTPSSPSVCCLPFSCGSEADK